jgi:hypothetical protein
MSATLAGSVTLQGGQKNLVIRFFTPGTTTEVAKYIRALDATGAFTVTGITPGTYDVGVKCDSSLSIKVINQVFVDGGTTTIVFGTLLGGDINGDDSVTGLDRSILLANWALSGGCAGYPGNWLMPDWPTAAGGGGASYKLIGGQHV